MPDEFLNDYNELEHAYAQDNQNIYVSYTGDYKANPLSHVHNSCELLFVEKGSGVYRIGNEEYAVGPRDVLIIGALDTHSRKFMEVPCIRYGLNLQPGYLEKLPVLNTYMNLYQTHSVKEAQKLKNIEPESFDRLVQLLLLLRKETENNSSGEGDMCYALLLELTITLQRLLNLEKLNLSDSYRTMVDIKEYINLHYTEDLSLEELSRRFYLQQNTISKNFKKTFGSNINTYINSVRISNAVRILESESVSITELAALVGYGSVNTFLRQFKEKMGESPLQYRKKAKAFIR